MSFITALEEVVQEVSDWAVDAIEQTVKVLAPDGRPFDYQNIPVVDQLDQYLQLKGNPQAWQKYVEDKAVQIAQKLQESGLQEDDVLSVHPFDIAVRYAINYSNSTESLLRKQNGS